MRTVLASSAGDGLLTFGLAQHWPVAAQGSVSQLAIVDRKSLAYLEGCETGKIPASPL